MTEIGDRQELERLRQELAQRQRREEEMKRDTEELKRKTARREEEMMRDMEELKRKTAAIVKEKEAAEQRLLRNGFPPLRGPLCSSNQSSSSVNVLHPKMSFTSSDFSTVSTVDYPLIPARSALWGFHDDRQLSWSTENDIQGYVRLALVEIIKTAGYAGQLELLNELSMVNVRPDIWVVRSNGRPIGVCEVKRPNAISKPSALLEEHLAGQIFNYMMRLREFSGLRYVFGVVTTYNEWRICWLRDTDECAASPTPLPSSRSPAAADLAINAEVHCSPIYQHHDPLLIICLASVLHKMHHSPASPPTTLISASRWYIKMGPLTYDWEQLPKDCNLTYAFPPTHTKYFFLLQDYHGGADGRVWLACSSSGCLVIIKFGRPTVPGALEKEAKCWQSIWGVASARVTSLGNHQALLMPFAFHISTEKGSKRFMFPNHWAKVLHGGDYQPMREIQEDNVLEPKVIASDPTEVARKAITAMVKAGYRHDDLAWRHVALLPVQLLSTWTLLPILIDLHRVSQLEPEGLENAQLLIDEQLEGLEKELCGTAEFEDR